MDWNGFNNQLSRSQGVLKPVTTYMFSLMIDAPPSHPDTILTTSSYMQRSLVDMGMAYVHLSVDMQLFVITKQVCWYKPEQFHNVIAYYTVIHKLHHKANAMFSIGSVCSNSIWGPNRYFQREVLGESHAVLSRCVSNTLEVVSINWDEDI